MIGAKVSIIYWFHSIQLHTHIRTWIVDTETFHL